MRNENPAPHAIEPGIYIEVETWENDGDNYMSEFVRMPSIEVAKEMVKLLQPFTDSPHNGPGYVGNLVGNLVYEFDDDENDSILIEALHPIFKTLSLDTMYFMLNRRKPCSVSLEELTDSDEIDSVYPDLMDSLFDIFLLSSEYYSTRVISKIKIYNVIQSVFEFEIIE